MPILRVLSSINNNPALDKSELAAHFSPIHSIEY